MREFLEQKYKRSQRGIVNKNIIYILINNQATIYVSVSWVTITQAALPRWTMTLSLCHRNDNDRGWDL